MKNKKMTFWKHVYELRNMILILLLFVLVFSVASYFLFPYFYSVIYNIIGENLYATNITEGFLTKLKVSIMVGFFLSIPVLLFETILFIFPALEKKQKVKMLAIIICTFILFVSGVVFAFKSVLPISIKFLKSDVFFPENVSRLISYNSFIVFFFQFLTGFGFCFQFPVILLFLLKFGLIKMKFLIKNFKYFFAGIFVVAAIITPPDITSQVLLAIPMLILYLLSMGIGLIFKLGKE